MKLIFSLFIFFSCSNLFGQNSNFKVLLTEGTNTFGQNQFITIGTEVPENQVINFQDEYLAVIDSEGKVIEIAEKGKYKIKDLKAKMNFQTSNLWKKYSSKDYLELGKKSSYMKKTGSVTICTPSTARFLMPIRSSVYGDQMIMGWYNRLEDYKTPPEIKGYEVYFVDLADQVLRNYYTDQDFLVVNWKKDSLLSEHKMFVVKVIGINLDGSKRDDVIQLDGIVIEKLEIEDHQAITQEIAQIQNPDCPILSQLILTNFFEEKDLLIDARLAYIKLLEMKNLAIFQTLYQNFLYRNRLTKEAYFAQD